MRSLSAEQRSKIRHSDKEYVTFHISVFNAGSVVTLSFANDPEEFDPETWNGYDFNTYISEVVTLLDRYHL